MWAAGGGEDTLGSTFWLSFFPTLDFVMLKAVTVTVIVTPASGKGRYGYRFIASRSTVSAPSLPRPR
jgi:hypothetical protein